MKESKDYSIKFDLARIERKIGVLFKAVEDIKVSLKDITLGKKMENVKEEIKKYEEELKWLNYEQENKWNEVEREMKEYNIEGECEPCER